MSKAKQVLGKDLMLFVGGEAIALATSCKIGVSAETIDTQSKDSGMWNEKDVKKLGWNCSSENCFSADVDINGYDALFSMMISAQPVDIAFGIPSNKANSLPSAGWTLPPSPYKGKAIITSLELNAPDGDKATFSVSLDGTGALSGGDHSAPAPTQISSARIGRYNLDDSIKLIKFPSDVKSLSLVANGVSLSRIKSISVECQDTDWIDFSIDISASKRTDTTIEATLTSQKAEFGTFPLEWLSIKGDGVALFNWGATSDEG